MPEARFRGPAPNQDSAVEARAAGDWLGIGHGSHDARLCGHVGEWIGGPDGEDILLRDLQDRDAGGCLRRA
jgi:hypothetical protein